MNPISLIVLGIGLFIILLCSAAMILIPSTYAKLHYLGPSATLGTTFICLAVLLQEGFSSAGIKSVLFAFFILVYSPILTHATSRAKRIRIFGVWQKINEIKKKKGRNG